jgi:hypothetical protein
MKKIAIVAALFVLTNVLASCSNENNQKTVSVSQETLQSDRKDIQNAD